MDSAIPDFFHREQVRITAAAQDLFLGLGLGAVTLAEVVMSMRLSVPELEGYFPGGKTTLVAAVADRFLTSFRQQLAQHGPQSSNAVEEMLRVRRTLQELSYDLSAAQIHPFASRSLVFYGYICTDWYNNTSRPPLPMTGRPKTFDEHEVIDRAQRVFWQRGYFAASTEELLAAMGIGKGSFYLAFPGGKKELFEKTMQQFHQENLRQLEQRVAASAWPVEVVKDYFRRIATAAPAAHDQGCYLANTVMEMTSLDPQLQQAAGQMLKQLEALFFTVIQQSQASGQLTNLIDARLLAQHLLTLWNGLSITRRLYPDNAHLRQLIDFQLTILT